MPSTTKTSNQKHGGIWTKVFLANEGSPVSLVICLSINLWSNQPSPPPPSMHVVGCVGIICWQFWFICRARADTDAAHRIQIEKLEDQVRSATEFKVCTPNKRKCHGKRRGGGEGKGEGAKGEWPLLYKHFLHSHLLPYRTGLTYAFYKGVIMKTYVELLLKSNRV